MSNREFSLATPNISRKNKLSFTKNWVFCLRFARPFFLVASFHVAPFESVFVIPQDVSSNERDTRLDARNLLMHYQIQI